MQFWPRPRESWPQLRPWHRPHAFAPASSTSGLVNIPGIDAIKLYGLSATGKLNTRQMLCTVCCRWYKTGTTDAIYLARKVDER